MTQPIFAEAEANSNIALIKYWGKLDRPGNYPAVPSLSLTLSDLCTRTRVELDEHLTSDEIQLDGVATAPGRPRQRIIDVLDHFRRSSERLLYARVTSHNDFPTAAGLASSASGFAALVTAANAAYGTGLTLPALSALARAASASAARSLFGGWSTLPVGADAAFELAPREHWPLVLLVAITASGKKPIGSTEAMNLTSRTSPYYGAWLTGAEALFEAARRAVLERDLTGLGTAMEQSTLMMHATMHTAVPAIVYWAPGTLNVMQRVVAWRKQNVDCYFTMDAGPHVKLLCHARDAETLCAELRGVDGVLDVIAATPGAGARLRSLG